MAVNPMQRKARNSFLLGVVITLLITSIVIAILFLQVTQLKSEADKLEKSYVKAYVLQTDIQSGKEITISDVKEERISKNMLPTDYISTAELTETTIAKVDISAGTVLTGSIITDSEESLLDGNGKDKKIRIQEYNMLVLPTQLEVDDYIDIRWMLPNGQDYIVASKKRVIDCNENTIWIKLDESEILTMSSAIVEAYTVTGSKLYAIKYIEPGIQETAITTYVPNSETFELMKSDPNILDTAKSVLASKYQNNIGNRNSQINSVLQNYTENALDNIESKLEEEIARQQEARQMYLDQLDASM